MSRYHDKPNPKRGFFLTAASFLGASTRLGFRLSRWIVTTLSGLYLLLAIAVLVIYREREHKPAQNGLTPNAVSAAIADPTIDHVVGLSNSASAGQVPNAPNPKQDRCVSLRVLANIVQSDLNSGTPVSSQIRELCGINWLERLDIDADSQDIILVGRSDPARPPILLDDLLVAFRAALSNEDPSCSLDPRPECVRAVNQLLKQQPPPNDPQAMAKFSAALQETTGPQMVWIDGVDPTTPWASAMITADYHMKAVSQGLFEVPGVESLAAISMRNDDIRKYQSNNAVQSRFWFHIAKDNPTFQESANLIDLNTCNVVVLTEKEKANADGRLQDVGEIDSDAAEFAKTFSDNFNLASSQERSYMRLENDYRLLALVKELVHRQPWGSPNFQFDLNFFKNCPYREPQNIRYEMPGLANIFIVSSDDKTAISYRAAMVSGGVDMHFDITRSQIASTMEIVDALTDTSRQVLAARPALTALWWTLRVSN